MPRLLNKEKSPRPDSVSEPLPPPHKVALDLGGDDDDDGPSGEIQLKVNEEYAKRFEHNKKREELQRLEEKYKSKKRKRKGSDDGSSDDSSEEDSDGSDDGSDDGSSDSETEDEFGEFADTVKDEDILATIKAIRSKDPRVYDGQTRFFRKPASDEEDEEGEGEEGEEGEDGGQSKKQKPMYLADYHRQNLLNGIMPGQDEEEGEAKPKTYLQQQEELKRELVKDMHNAAEQLSGDEDDFLTTKSVLNTSDLPPPPDPEAADPNDPDAYLTNYLTSKAWLPKDKKSIYGPVLESDDSEEEEAMELYEQGFNLRFEDPSKAAQLVGHARGAVKMMSARKEAMSARKRAREARKQKKEEEKRQQEIEKGRLRALKVEQLMEKVKKIKEAAGLEDIDGESEDLKDWKKLLEGGWSDEKWDEMMAKRFGDQYYENKESEEVVKPYWDDDIDITDIVGESDQEGGGVELDGEVNGKDDQEVDEDASASKPKKKSRKDFEREKREKKKKERELRKEVENYVDENIDLDAEISGGKASAFRYREVTPETFGLTPLDILMADDAHLNQYAGLKKYAAYREKERKKQDKKKYSKKRLLREWRKAVFGDETGPAMPKLDVKEEAATEKKIAEAEDKMEAGLSNKDKKKKRRKRK